jgi:hypothetical protein
MFLRFILMFLPLITPTSIFADQKFNPYVKDNILYIDPPGAGARVMKNIKITGSSVKYLGGKPFCIEVAKVDFVTLVPSFDGDEFDIEVNFQCPINDPNEGCTNRPWQKCAVDQTLPQDYPIRKCETDSPPRDVSAECKLSIVGTTGIDSVPNGSAK